jgi:hypothetical protein
LINQGRIRVSAEDGRSWEAAPVSGDVDGCYRNVSAASSAGTEAERDGVEAFDHICCWDGVDADDRDKEGESVCELHFED